MRIDAVIARAIASSGLTSAVNIEVAVEKTPVAKVDPTHAERALVEILHNAKQHGRPPVRVRLAIGGERVEVRVRDGGPGLPRHLDPVSAFEPYVQGAGGDRAPTGEGLGLALARAHCRAMGADVRYEPASREFVLSLMAPA